MVRHEVNPLTLHTLALWNTPDTQGSEPSQAVTTLPLCLHITRGLEKKASSTWVDLDIVVLSEVSHRRRNII